MLHRTLNRNKNNQNNKSLYKESQNNDIFASQKYLNSLNSMKYGAKNL